jgi:hypothetical protein
VEPDTDTDIDFADFFVNAKVEARGTVTNPSAPADEAEGGVE